MNNSAVESQIEYARSMALTLLQPSPSELAHGLELHREFTIVDAYGFSPWSAIDSVRMQQAVDAGASVYELQDLHEDMIMTRHVDDTDARSEYEAAWKASGVTCVMQNSGEEVPSIPQLLKRFARYTFCTDKLPEILYRATQPYDIEAAKKKGLHCLYMTTNSIPLVGQSKNLEEELGYIKILAQLGCRMMHMTYNRRNMIGDGCMELSNAGLSDLGVAAVREMNRNGVICDVAHCGWQTSIDVAKASARPVVSSHSSCWELHHHRRAKTDEVIAALADSGGYNAICCIPDFLGGGRNLQNFLDHIDYMVRKFGADHVAIGTDAAYTSITSEVQWQSVRGYPKRRPYFESFWQPGEHPDHVDQTLSWTNWPLFTVGLVQRGHSDETIQKIVGGNALRVAMQNLA